MLLPTHVCKTSKSGLLDLQSLKTSSICSLHRDADRVAGLLEANNIYNVKLLVNRVRPDMIQRNDMMSVRDVQVGGLVLLGAAVAGFMRSACTTHPPAGSRGGH